VPSCFETSLICFCRGNACTDDTKKWSVCSVVNRHTPKSPLHGRIMRQCRISRETSCESSAKTGRVRQEKKIMGHCLMVLLPCRPSHRSRFPPPQPPSYSAQAHGPGIHRHLGSLPLLAGGGPAPTQGRTRRIELTGESGGAAASCQGGRSTFCTSRRN
jgi:hypothetical protein